jgi:hypothetical protein
VNVERRLAAAAVAATLTSIVLVPSPSAHGGAPLWSLRAVLSRIDGAHVSVGAWAGHVQSESTLCNGEGTARRWSGVRHWRHFTCTWTVFDRRGGVDRDVTFRVHTQPAGRYLISDSRFGPD